MSSHHDVYFKRVGANTFTPTEHAVGAWDTNQQHVSPLFGLLAHLVEQDAQDRRPDDELAVTRISNEIFGVVPLQEFAVAVNVLRPGKTIELVQATVTSNDRILVESRFWRLAHYPTDHIANSLTPPIPPADEGTKVSLSDVWDGGYIASVQATEVEAPEVGRASAWIHTNITILDEDISDFAAIVGLVDTSNGVAPPQPVDEWLYPNVDLSIHFLRPPVGRTLGLETTVNVGPYGHGITSSVLFDEQGHLGYANQSLTIRPQPD